MPIGAGVEAEQLRLKPFLLYGCRDAPALSAMHNTDTQIMFKIQDNTEDLHYTRNPSIFKIFCIVNKNQGVRWQMLCAYFFEYKICSDGIKVQILFILEDRSRFSYKIPRLQVKA